MRCVNYCRTPSGRHHLWSIPVPHSLDGAALPCVQEKHMHPRMCSSTGPEVTCLLPGTCHFVETLHDRS